MRPSRMEQLLRTFVGDLENIARGYILRGQTVVVVSEHLVADEAQAHQIPSYLTKHRGKFGEKEVLDNGRIH